MIQTPFNSTSEIDHIELLSFARDNRDSDGGIAWRKWQPQEQKDSARSKYQRLMRAHGFNDGEFTVNNTDEVLRYYLGSEKDTFASDDPAPEDNPPRHAETTSEGNDVTVRGDTNLSFDEAQRMLDEEGLDPDRWQVGQYWHTPNGKSVMFRPKSGGSEGAESRLEDLIEEMKAWSPDYANLSESSREAFGDENLLELALYDAHIGQLSWHEEVGENYDLDIAEERFMDAVDRLLDRASHLPIDRILLPWGNDFLNVDKEEAGVAGVTAGGTLQDGDGRPAKMFNVGERIGIRTIDKCRSMAPTDVIVVQGNHAPQREWYLAKVLSAWYRHCDNVTVDCSPQKRSYYQWGSCLIGFTHGKDEKLTELPMIMASEVPELWGQTRWREMHCGHFHHRREYQSMPLAEHKGVRVRILPPLASADSWHYEQGYVGSIKAGMGLLWNQDEGCIAEYSVNIH